MMDPLFNTLAERFAGHETDVDPGTWSAISGQLAVASGGSLSGLLQEKFAGHEATVDPQVWTNISSQLGHGAAAGVGSTAGWWAAGIAASLVAGGLLVYNLAGETSSQQVAAKVQAVPTNGFEQPKIQEHDPEQENLPVMPVLSEASSSTAKDASTQPAHGSGGTKAPAVEPEADPATDKPLVPAPTPEGEKTVNAVLQNIVDNYVTSPIVVVTEPKVPPPTQNEMPSKAVHPEHEEEASDDASTEEPVLPTAVPAPTLAVMIPTAFSPNGDNVNDDLAVTVQHYEKATVRIFSASSNALVFGADNLEARWNGRVMNSGQPCEPGMYFYALEVTDKEGRTWSKGEVVRLFKQ